ncbi:hypothetical protein AB8O53_30485, partial [Streptomyces pilosus]
MTPYALTVDAGIGDLLDADRLLHRMAAELDLPEDVFGCTHLVRDDRPRVVVSLSRLARPRPRPPPAPGGASRGRPPR